MFRRPDDAAPWEQGQGRPQVAGDYTPAAIGAEPGESSPWYVGRRYIADASLAARVRQVEQAKEADRAARQARYTARQRGEG